MKNKLNFCLYIQLYFMGKTYIQAEGVEKGLFMLATNIAFGVLWVVTHNWLHRDDKEEK